MQYNKNKNQSSKLFIYGRHAVLAALNNKRRKSKALYTTRNIFDEIRSNYPNLQVQIKDPKELGLMVGEQANHQNMILEVEPLAKLHIEDILDKTFSKETSCIVILDQVTDPHNIGAILRSAAAFNVDAVILPENNSPKENSTIIKTSAGATEIVPLIHVTNLVSAIKQLKDAGFWIMGLDGNTSTILDKKLFAKKQVLVLGSEDTGMRKLTRENCDYIAKIDISSNAESLNVSNAAVIAMYEFSKSS